ncbi:MAG: D-alanyl-D-alanine carboxypeptidase family protein [Bacillota bacterium]|nr:D-alanyl-D-alanine carboxypeptidase family protein [Bacillota bacterium]
MFKRITSFILAAVIAGGMFGADIQAFDVSAQSAILIEETTGKVLFERNADARRPMASITKIMTAVVALENSNLTDKVQVSPKAVAVEGSKMYLKAGETVTMEELLYGLMLASGNDAANAIAEHVAGDNENFVKLMNAKAHELHLANTSFETPSGLDGDDHYTSARDFANLTAEALKNRDFATIVSTKSKRFSNDEGVRLIVNHNRLLSIYKYAVGVKTGFTKKSGRCLVSAAEKDGVTLIAVTLNAPDDWDDHSKLLDYGFSCVHKITPADDSDRYDLHVVNSPVSSISVSPKPDRSIMLFGEDESKLTKSVELEHFVYAPVKRGDIVGRISYYQNGDCVGSIPLVSNEDAPMLESKRKNSFFSWISHIFFGK